MLLPHFSHVSPKCAYRLFFSAYSGIFDGSFNISVSVIYFYYVSLPRPSGCQQNGTIHVSGPLWNEMWELVSSNSVGLPYFRRIFGVYAVRIFFKCRIKLACLTWIGILSTTLTFLRWVTTPPPCYCSRDVVNDLQDGPTARGSEPLNRIRDHWTSVLPASRDHWRSTVAMATLKKSMSRRDRGRELLLTLVIS